MKIYKLIILFMLPCLLTAQFDEKEILKKQAANHVTRRQYERANSIYEQILHDHPKDVQTIELYLTNLLRISKFSLAEQKLALYESDLPQISYMRLRIPILISLGEVKKARDLSRDFLAENRGNIGFYQTMAAIFSQYRQDEISIEIYELARNISKDDNLFARELAQSYENAGKFDQAIKTYFQLLVKQQAYANYILSRFQTMLQQDESLIKTIKQESQHYPDPNAGELYALCLAYIGDYDEALIQYEKLDIEKLNNFARRMKLNGNFEVAARGFKIYLQSAADVPLQANARIELAETLIKLAQFDEAKEVLMLVYEDQQLKSRSFRYRTKASRRSRELLAELLLREKGNEDLAVQYLQEAKDFSFNQSEKNEIEFKIINLLMLLERFDESKLKLTNLLKSESPGTDTFKKGYLYSYLLAVFQRDTAADSLLMEIIINLPEDQAANDALFLEMMIQSLNPNSVADFLAAYRRKLIFRDQEAIGFLEKIYEESNNEEILFLIGEWMLESGRKDAAKTIFRHDFENEIIGEYALLKLAQLSGDETMKRKFLSDNPGSVFSPLFRMIINR